MTAAWSLRRLQVKSTFEPMLEATAQIISNKLEPEAPGRRPPQPQGPRHDQIAHLFEAFGEADFQPAKQLVRQYVLQGSAGTYRRPSNSYSAAISSAGKLYRDDANSTLAGKLNGVLNNIREGCPNDRATAALAMGRMKADSQLTDLRKYYQGGIPRDPINYASAWAIREITGEEFPPPQLRTPKAVDFELTPSVLDLNSQG